MTEECKVNEAIIGAWLAATLAYDEAEAEYEQTVRDHEGACRQVFDTLRAITRRVNVAANAEDAAWVRLNTEDRAEARRRLAARQGRTTHEQQGRHDDQRE